MSFLPRTFTDIRDTAFNYLKANTNLTDYEIGSVIRTLVEAGALEDDEQYFQMVQLLDDFSYQTATGVGLDKRLADFALLRLQPASSAGKVVINDLNLVTSFTQFDVITGGTSLILDSSADFPVPGPPFTVRIGESTLEVEDVTCTANVVGTNTLTVSALANNHSGGARVSFVSGAASQAIGAGVQVQVQSQGGASPVKFVTTGTGTIVNGNYQSTPIIAKAAVPGSPGNIGIGQINQFTTSPPFTGAGVTNLVPFVGGRDLELDPNFRDRGRGTLQSLSRGTKLAIRQAALGVSDPVTGQRVVTANIIEDFIAEEVILYVDDGTGFTPDTVPLARTTLNANAGIGVGTLTVVDVSDFPQTGFVVVSPEDPAQIELLEFSAVDYTFNTITLVGTTTRTHNGVGAQHDEVTLVDVLEFAAQAGTRFMQTAKFPIVRNSNRLWVDSGAGLVLNNDITDYFLNKATGEVELVTGLLVNSKVVTAYTYYSGLIKTVQTIIDGDPADPVNIPGVVADGVIALVETPIIHRVSVRLAITANPGNETNLAPQVKSAVESYISGLGIGEDVILAEIVKVAMEVNGMFNVMVITPAADVTILENELPVPFDSSGNSLVVVN